MSPTMMFVVAVSLFAAQTSSASVVDASLAMPLCPDGQFLDSKQECRVCSSCPPDLIIRGPCGPYTDTQCRPFIMFDDFHQASKQMAGRGFGDDYGLTEEGTLERGEDGEGRGADEGLGTPDGAPRSGSAAGDSGDHKFRKHSRIHPFHGRQHPALTRGGSEHPDVFTDLSRHNDARKAQGVASSAGSGAASRQGNDHVPSVQNPDEAENQWKVLALALIVVLCVVCVFLIVFVFVVCYLRSSKSHLKQVLYSADQSPQRPGPHSRPTCVSLRYVPVPTHAQGAGRPGTSGGSGMTMGTTPPCGKRSAVDSSYMFSDEYDAEHSGQTASTTKSSDYVYFKTPLSSYDVCDV